MQPPCIIALPSARAGRDGNALEIFREEDAHSRSFHLSAEFCRILPNSAIFLPIFAILGPTASAAVMHREASCRLPYAGRWCGGPENRCLIRFFLGSCVVSSSALVAVH